MITHPPAILTPEAIAAGVTGPAVLRCTLLEDGVLYRCSLVDPMPLMERRIFDVLWRWRYQPARESGVPVAVDVLVSIPLVPPEPALAPATPTGAPPATAVIPFGPGMSRPTQESGTGPLYTREARERKVEGMLLVKCIITIDGTLEGCQIMRPLPFQNRAVLDALATARYKPVTFHGQPVPVSYVLTFNFRLQ